jgi:phage-related tail fiber protein
MHPTIANYIVIETIIPSNIGGFWIREMGIIADNVLISHGSHAPFFKPADPEGVSEYRLKFTQNVRDGNVVEISLDESLIYASQAWVDENYIPRSEIVDNLTTDDATKVASARTVKELQEKKLEKNDLKDASTTQKGIVKLNNTLNSTSETEAATAAQAKILNEKIYGYGQDYVDVKSSRASNVTYPNPTDQVMHVIACFEFGSSLLDYAVVYVNGREIFKKDIGGGNGAYAEVSFPVPPQGNYRIDKQNYINIISWKEFKRI